MSDDVLFELFRAEVQEHADALSAGLVALERDPSGAQFEPLMRAAHSIKGAARILAVDRATELAHEMEDLLVAAGKGKVALTGGAVDILLRGVDVLATLTSVSATDLPNWGQTHAAQISEIAAALRDVTAGRSAPAPAAPPAETPPAGTAAPVSTMAVFRDEAAAHASALAEGLAVLRADLARVDLLKPLSGAAHLIKGAGRLVGIDDAVRVAGAAEKVLDDARAGRATLDDASVQRLVECASFLSRLTEEAGADAAAFAAWLTARHAEVEALLASLAAAEAAAVPQAFVQPAPKPGALPATPAPSSQTGEGYRPDRFVRVTSESMSSLLGLAGETLVESRRLGPFATSLHKLAKRQAALADMLAELQQRVGGTHGAGGDEASAALAQATVLARDCKSLVLERSAEFERYARDFEDVTGRLYRETLSSRMRPFADGVQGFPRMVRDLARKLGKDVEFAVYGGTVGVDRDVLDKIEAPLNHLLRNALDHGVEVPDVRTGKGKAARAKVSLEARHWAGMLTVTVSDDGRGIDPAAIRRKVIDRGLATEADVAAMEDSDVLDYIFTPGFSTAAEVTEISGRGVGLDVVQNVVKEFGGVIRVSSEPGKGAAFHLQLPITLSVLRVVVVDIAGEPYAFPLSRITRVVTAAADSIRQLEGRQYLALDGKSLGLVPAVQILDLDGAPPAGDEICAIVISHRATSFGIVVDRFVGEQDVVVRPLDPRLGKVVDLSAAAILPDGSPMLILDVEDLGRSIVRLLSTARLAKVGEAAAADAAAPRKRILVVDDSITVREVQRQFLTNRGYDVQTAVDGIDALQTLNGGTFDLVITDVDMPRMNGLALVRSIKQDQRMRAIPVMIVSYRESEEDRRRGLEVGADFYITKGRFQDETLLQAVTQLIGEP